MKNLNLQLFILFIIIAGTESSTCSYKKFTTSTFYKTAYKSCLYGCCSSKSTGCCSSSQSSIQFSSCPYKRLTTSTGYKTAYTYCTNGCCSSGTTGCCSSYPSYSSGSYYRLAYTVYSRNWIWYSVGGGISGLVFLIVIIIGICVACRRRSNITTVVGTPSAGGVAVVNTNAMQQQVPMSSFGGTTNYAYGVPTGYPYNPPNTAGYPYYNGQPQPQPQPPVQPGPPVPPAYVPEKTH